MMAAEATELVLGDSTDQAKATTMGSGVDIKDDSDSAYIGAVIAPAIKSQTYGFCDWNGSGSNRIFTDSSRRS